MRVVRRPPSYVQRLYSKLAPKEVSLVEIGHKWKAKVLKGVPPPKVTHEEKKMYLLTMFPYPSGSLHIGHLRVYTITDALNRFYRLNGYQVLHPMGWDAFGLPAENAAIERRIDPAVWTKQNIAKMKQQLSTMLANFDWDREVTTCSPEYYKFTQEIFLELFKHGLAYQKDAEINWDPVDKTVLANEQVDAQGRSWRSGAIVEKRKLNQWFLGITKFAHSLQKDLGTLKEWPQNVKTMQKNWVGESHGTEVHFSLSQRALQPVKVFTTRVETLFSVQYLALAIDHPLVQEASLTDLELQSFLDLAKSLPNDSKEGFLLKGIRAHNPLSHSTQFEIPIFVAPYVLSGYGHGAVMGCPAHDERDFAFWEQSMPGISPLPSITHNGCNTERFSQLPYTKKSGILGPSAAEFAGMDVNQAAQKIAEELERVGKGKSTTNYRLRDWLISRQRYWGAPIPIIHCESCGPVAVPKEDLPVMLPKVHSLATKGNPLKNMAEFVDAKCPSCGSPAKRETDTMDTFMDSSWYFFRYTDPKNIKDPFSHKAASENLPVDLYIGGIEHAILHLLYSRFISKFLASIGKWEDKQGTGEPFKKLVTQGMVHGKTLVDPTTGRFLKPDEVETTSCSDVIIKETGQKPTITYEKMSKSKYNGADPDKCIESHGPDATRAHILFQAPISDVLSWDETKIVGVERWLIRTVNLSEAICSNCFEFDSEYVVPATLSGEEVVFHNKVQKLLESITLSFSDSLSLNTVISDYMKLTNLIEAAHNSQNISLNLIMNALKILITSMYPVAPTVAEEACDILSKKLSWSWNLYEWPSMQAIRQNAQVRYNVVVNGKMRFTHCADKSFIDDRECVIKTLTDSPAGKKYIGDKVIRNLILKNKVISFVVE